MRASNSRKLLEADVLGRFACSGGVQIAMNSERCEKHMETRHRNRTKQRAMLKVLKT